MWTMLMTHHTMIPMHSMLAKWTQRLLELHKHNSNILREFARYLLYIMSLIIFILRFDPNFPMVANGMRFAPPPQPIPIPPDGDIDVDEHGNIDWQNTWLKELNHLQQVTAEQDKQQVDQEWYRMMLFRVRGALMAPLNPAETMAMTGQAHGEGSQTQEVH